MVSDDDLRAALRRYLDDDDDLVNPPPADVVAQLQRRGLVLIAYSSWDAAPGHEIETVSVTSSGRAFLDESSA